VEQADEEWVRYENQASEDKTAFFLRQDAGLLDKIFHLL